MKKEFAVTVTRTIKEQVTVYVRAMDDHEAADKGCEFVQTNASRLTSDKRFIFSGREYNIYKDGVSLCIGANCDVEA